MDPEIKNYLDNVETAYQDAYRAAGCCSEYFFTINGLGVRLCFAGDAVRPFLLPAFEHLGCDEVTNTLTVKIWDYHATGVPLPSAPWSVEMEQQTDKMLMFNQGSVHMLYNPASTVYSLIDTKSRTAYYYVPDAGMIPYYESSAPMRMILHWWFEENEMQMLHAAAVGYREKGILLVGKGGSGKSTTAVAALLNGLDYVGDDYIVVAADPARAFSIYNSVKVNDDMLVKMPELGEYVSNPERPESEKWLVFLKSGFGRGIVKELAVKAVVMPVVSGRDEAHIYGISSIKAFAELASSTLFQMPGSGEVALKGLKRVMKDLPVFALELSDDFAGNTSVLKECIVSFTDK